MQNIVGFYVFTTRDGGLWLAGDEKSWSSDFLDANEFFDEAVAKGVGERECTDPRDRLHVFALASS